MNKKIVVFLTLLMICMMFVPCVSFGASVTINGQMVEFSENAGEPFMDAANRVQVPLRTTMEAAGCQVDWDEDSWTATVKKNGVTVRIPVGQAYIIRDKEVIENDSKAVIKDHRTYLPIRAVFEAFGADVDWDSHSSTVSVSLENRNTTSSGITALTEPLTAKQIAKQASPAVFFIEVYQAQSDYANHYPVGTGSGFFITEDGIAVTNYHVIEDSSIAVVTMTDGSQHRITDVLYYDKEADYAVVRVSKQSLLGRAPGSFPYLHIRDSSELENGDVIYAIGSPLGLQNSISNGIISNKDRQEEGRRYLQFTAPISSGSSGGALIDEYGNAIGITAGSFENGQNLNIAFPMDDILRKNLSVAGTTYSQVYEKEFNNSLVSEGPDIMERMIQEQSNEEVENYQPIKNGDTIIGTFSSVNNVDYYYFNTPIPVRAEIIAGGLDAKYDGNLDITAYKEHGVSWDYLVKSSLQLRLDQSPGTEFLKGTLSGDSSSLAYGIKDATLEPGVYFIRIDQNLENEQAWKDRQYYVYLKLTSL